MVCKNRNIQKLEKTADRTQHYGIRKLTIGAVSVLLGTTLFLANGGMQARAESTAPSVTTSEKVNQNKQETNLDSDTSSNKPGTVSQDQKQSEVKQNQDNISDKTKEENNVQNNSSVNEKNEVRKDAVSSPENQSQLKKDSVSSAISSAKTGTTSESISNSVHTVPQKAEQDQKQNNTNQLEIGNKKETNEITIPSRTQISTEKDSKENNTNSNAIALKRKYGMILTKSDDQATTTLNFVDEDSGQTIYSQKLTGPKDETIYEALGNKTIYDRILEDYPSYLTDVKHDFSVDSSGNFINAAAKESFEKWQQEYHAGKHPLFDYIPDMDDPRQRNLRMFNKNSSYVQALAGIAKLGDQSSYTINLTRAWGYLYVPAFSNVQRPISYYKHPSELKHDPAYVDKDANAYSIIGNPSGLSNTIILAESQHRKVVFWVYNRSYQDYSASNPGAPVNSGETAGGTGIALRLYFPAESASDRAKAEVEGDFTGWTTLDGLVPEIGPQVPGTVPGYVMHQDGTWGYIDNDYHFDDTKRPTEAKIIYYQNQPFHVVFKDISQVNPQDLSSYDYNPADMTLAANSKTNPHGGATNNHYVAYQLDAGIYNNKISDLENQGYVLVSSDINLGKQSYDANKLKYDSKGNVKPIIYTVEVEREAKPKTENKSVTRQIKYVANSINGAELQGEVTQQLELTGTYFVDQKGNRVNAEELKDVHGNPVKDSSNNVIYVVASGPAKETWTITSGTTPKDVTSNSDGTYIFNAATDAEKPSTINVGSSWSTAHNNVATGIWYYFSKDNDEQVPIDLTKDEALKPICIIYKQKASYSIHYIDVTDPVHHQELTGYEIKNIGGNSDQFVGDTPDATANVTSNNNELTDKNYVIVKESANLGKQTLTTNVKDQYVYLVHKRTTVPPSKTPTYPSNVQETDKKATQVTVTRNISYYDADNNDASLTSLAPTVKQNVTYGRTAVYDLVTGKFLGWAKLDNQGHAITDQNGLDEVDKNLTDSNSWKVLTSDDENQADYAAVTSPDLSDYGYQKAMSFSDKHNDGDAAKAPEADADPTKNGTNIKIYYYHDTESINSKNPKKTTDTINPKGNTKYPAGLEKDDLEQTVTRKIYYRGTKDGGKTYQSVGDLQTETNPLVQTVTFEKTAIIDKVTGKLLGYDTNGDGKVDTQNPDQAWTTKKSSFDLVSVPTADSEGYDKVDKSQVDGVNDVKPGDQSKYLDPIVVTYSMNERHASIVYHDDTTGKDIIPKTSDSDKFGKPGEDIHFAKNPSDQIKELEDKGYILVRNDFGSGQKYSKDKTNLDFEVHFVHGVDPKSVTKTAERIVHYVEADNSDPSKATVLQDPTPQTVTFNGSYYLDLVEEKKGNTVKVDTEEVKDINGNTVKAVKDDNGQISWVAEDGKSTFDQVKQPTITKGTIIWDVTDASKDNAPQQEVKDSVANKSKSDVYLIYRQEKSYTVHYRDVTGESSYTPTSGIDLGHSITVSGHIGDTTPDESDKLWKFDQNKYVVVKEDSNLAKQELTPNTRDQYVYLMHKVIKVTSKTPKSDIPKTSDGTPSFDPDSLSKDATRTIYYRANTQNGTDLITSTVQKVNFQGTIYLDVVTGKTTTPEIIKDSNNTQVQVATDKPGKITWTAQAANGSSVKNNKASFDQIIKDQITNGSLPGIWDVTADTKNNAPVQPVADPLSKDWKDNQVVYLIYTQKPSHNGGGTNPTPNPEPGNNPGTTPGNTPGKKPDNNPGKKPGTKPGNTPGKKPGNNPGTKPGKKPDTKPSNKPGTKSGTKSKKPGIKTPVKSKNKTSKHKELVKENKTKKSNKKHTIVPKKTRVNRSWNKNVIPKYQKVANGSSKNNAPLFANESNGFNRNNKPLYEDAAAYKNENKNEVTRLSNRVNANINNSKVTNSERANSEYSSELPQTGVKKNNTTIWGAILALAGLFGLGFVDRKKKRE